jgi:RNA recognition motif-containing protein
VSPWRWEDGPLLTESVDPSKATSTISSAHASAEDGSAQTADNSGNQGGADARKFRYIGHGENEANRPSRNVNDMRYRVKGMPSNSIYVGNLSFEATEKDLEERFGAFGKVLDSSISKDSLGRSKGYT